MKRIALTLLAVVLVAFPVFSQNVDIPDANFLVALIEEGLDTNKDGQISYAEAEAVIYLEVDNSGIMDMAGIEAFLNLKDLRCSGNQITSLDVSNNTALEGLDCGNNQLSSLDVSNNLLLGGLSCDNNQLSSLDVSNNIRLRHLRLSGNQLTTLDVSNNKIRALGSLGLANMPDLTEVCVWEGFPLEADIDTTGSPNVEFSVDCGYNIYVFIPDTAFLNALIEEGVDTNVDGQISIEEAKATTSLKFDDPSITDMTGIEAFINLLTLDCGFIQMSSLDVSMNTALTTLICPQNDLNSLDVSACTALKYLTCWGNQFSSLDVSACESLTELDCRWSQLTNLDVSGLTALEKINCNGSELSSLDASGCIALTVLGCNDNQLTSLDVSGCTSLISLPCWGNKLTSLDVSGNTTLGDLRCFSNQLSSLDVSGCTALTKLNCFDNQLTSLDVSSCPALIELVCSNNQLTSLNVSGCTVLKDLYCSHNDLIRLDLSTNKEIAQGHTISPWGGFHIFSLDVGEMPTLHEICVWDGFEGVQCNITGSPNVCFETDCNGVCGYTGIREKNLLELSILPNPVNSLLTIETDNPDHFSINITTLNGQLIFSTKVEGTSHQIDLSPFQKGVYIITIRSKDFVTTRKIIKL